MSAIPERREDGWMRGNRDGNKASHVNMPYVLSSHILPGRARLHSWKPPQGRKGQACGNLFFPRSTRSVAWPWFPCPLQTRDGGGARKRRVERQLEKQSDAWMNTSFMHLCHGDLILVLSTWRWPTETSSRCLSEYTSNAFTQFLKFVNYFTINSWKYHHIVSMFSLW